MALYLAESWLLSVFRATEVNPLILRDRNMLKMLIIAILVQTYSFGAESSGPIFIDWPGRSRQGRN